MKREADVYIEILIRLINKQRTKKEISPASLALDALRELDVELIVEKGNKPIWRLANLQLRQLARGLLKFDVVAKKRLFDDAMFPGLQWRYPAAYSDEESEPRYVLRDQMSRADAAWNIQRLRAEGEAKIEHGDTLFEWATRQWPGFDLDER